MTVEKLHAYKADYLISRSDKIIKNGIVVIQKGLIKDVLVEAKFKKKYPGLTFTYQKNSILSAAFVNAHTHIELSFLKKITKHKNFTHWVELLNKKRLSTEFTQQRQGVFKTLNEAIAEGTLVYADITNTALYISDLNEMPIKVRHFIEVLGFQKKRADLIWRSCLEKFDNFLALENVSLSPHALYSVSVKLLKKIASQKRLVSIHIDEADDERLFLKTKKGIFRELLERIGVYDDSFKTFKNSPYDYFRKFYSEKNIIWVHALNANKKDLKSLKNSKIVLCPRSNFYLHQKKVDLISFVKENPNCAIGTDSTASNDDISILREMRYILKTYKLSGNTIYKMATENGAKVLNFKELGCIEKNKTVPLLYIHSKNKITDVFETIINSKKLEINIIK